MKRKRKCFPLASHVPTCVLTLLYVSPDHFWRLSCLNFTISVDSPGALLHFVSIHFCSQFTLFVLSHCLSLLTKLLALPIDGVCDVAAKNRNETLVYGFTFFFSIMGSGCNIASFFLFFLVVSMSAICRIFILLQSLLVVCCSILKNKTTFLGWIPFLSSILFCLVFFSLKTSLRTVNRR